MPVGIIRLLNTEPISSDTNVLYLDNDNKLNFKKNNSNRGTIVANLQLDNINQNQKNEINTTSINLIDDLINFTLNNNGTTSTNNIITKTSASGFNAGVYSSESYTGSAYLKFKSKEVNNHIMIGFNTDPTTDSDYQSIDYALYLNDNESDGTNGVINSYYKDGTAISITTRSYAVNDIFEMIYSGTTIDMYHNGILFHTIANVTVNSRFYLDTSIHDQNKQSVEILEFASAPSNYIITNSLETINTSNNSFTFNGTSDYLEIPRHIAPQLANSDFTIEFWANINNLTLNYYHTFYAQGPNDYYQNLSLYYFNNGTNNSLNLDFYGGGVGVNIDNINFNDWNHYTIVLDNSKNSLKSATTFYINGNKIDYDSSVPEHENREIIASGQVTIGKANDVEVNYFDGELKHLRVYNSIKYSSNFSVNTTEHTVISNPYLPINLDLLIYIPMINKEKIVYHNNNNILSNNNRLYCYQNELYFENGKVITENSQTAPIRFKNNYVGINTSYAQNPLQVAGYGGDITGSYTYFNNSATLNNNTNLQNIQLYAQGNIYASLLIAASDSRIKTNIEELVDNEALIKFRQLKPCKYNYIDTVTRTSEKVFGFIAQEVREILPHATSITEEYIPNIYKSALYKDTVITFDNEHNLESEGNIKLIKPNNTEVIVPYVIIDTHKINIITSNLSSNEILSNDLVQDEDGNDLAHNIFVYGTSVDDFHTLNKDAIWATAIAALQEVDKIQQEDIIKINNLVDENTELKDKVSTLETELETLELELTNALNETLQLEQ